MAGWPPWLATLHPCLAWERDGWLGRSAFTLTKRTCLCWSTWFCSLNWWCCLKLQSSSLWDLRRTNTDPCDLVVSWDCFSSKCLSKKSVWNQMLSFSSLDLDFRRAESDSTTILLDKRATNMSDLTWIIFLFLMVGLIQDAIVLPFRTGKYLAEQFWPAFTFLMRTCLERSRFFPLSALHVEQAEMVCIRGGIMQKTAQKTELCSVHNFNFHPHSVAPKKKRSQDRSGIFAVKVSESAQPPTFKDRYKFPVLRNLAWSSEGLFRQDALITMRCLCFVRKHLSFCRECKTDLREASYIIVWGLLWSSHWHQSGNFTSHLHWYTLYLHRYFSLFPFGIYTWKSANTMVPLWNVLPVMLRLENVNFSFSFNMMNAVSARERSSQKIRTDTTHALSIFAPTGMMYKLNVAYTCHNNLHRTMISNLGKYWLFSI